MKSVSDILHERERTHGSFREVAMLSQRIKQVLHSSPNWVHLTFDKKESLEMMASKMARILAGNPEYIDNWVDIAGYAQLISEWINGQLPVGQHQDLQRRAASAPTLG